MGLICAYQSRTKPYRSIGQHVAGFPIKVYQTAYDIKVKPWYAFGMVLDVFWYAFDMVWYVFSYGFGMQCPWQPGNHWLRIHGRLHMHGWLRMHGWLFMCMHDLLCMHGWPCMHGSPPLPPSPSLLPLWALHAGLPCSVGRLIPNQYQKTYQMVPNPCQKIKPYVHTALHRTRT